MQKLVWTLLLCVLCVSRVNALTIKGMVSDSATGAPLELVNISIKHTPYGAATDRDGKYIITNIPEGNYTIVFSIVGYKQVEKSITIKDEVLEVNVVLSTEPIKMKEVKVRSERAEFESDVGVSSMKIGIREIDKLPSFLQADLLRILQAMPGVVTVGEFSTALYVRGGDCDQNLVLLDGATLFNPFHIGGVVSTFDVDAVKSADFITGGFPAKFGGRLSSVLDVHTRAGNTDKFSGIGTIGFLYSKLLLEGPMPGGSFLLSARRTYIDKVLPIFGAEFPYYFYDIQGKINFHISGRTKAFVSGFCSKDEFDFKGEDERVNVGEKIYLGWENQAASLSLSHMFSPQLFNETYITHSRFGYNVDVAGGLFSVADSVKEWGVKSNFTYRKHAHELEFGFDVKQTDFNFNVSFQGGFQYNVDAIPNDVAFYLQDKWKLGSLILSPGIRLNWFWADYTRGYEEKIPTHFRPAPVIGVKYFLSRDIAVKAAAGKYFQFVAALLPEEHPAPFIFPWAPVFGKYQPEEAWHYILGLERWLSETTTLSVEAYYKKFDNLLTFNEQSEPGEFVSDIFHIGKGYSYGVDMLFKKRAGRVTGWLAYSTSLAQVTFNNQNYYPSYDRPHNLNIIGEVKLPWELTLSTKWTFGTGTPYTPIIGWYKWWFVNPITGEYEWSWKGIPGKKNSARFPDYHRLDIGFGRNFAVKKLNISLTLSVINLYNRKNVLLYYYDYTSSIRQPMRKEIYTIPLIPCLELHFNF